MGGMVKMRGLPAARPGVQGPEQAWGVRSFSWKDRVSGRECKYSRGTVSHEIQKVTCAPGSREVGGALGQDLSSPPPPPSSWALKVLSAQAAVTGGHVWL